MRTRGVRIRRFVAPRRDLAQIGAQQSRALAPRRRYPSQLTSSVSLSPSSLQPVSDPPPQCDQRHQARLVLCSGSAQRVAAGGWIKQNDVLWRLELKCPGAR